MPPPGSSTAGPASTAVTAMNGVGVGHHHGHGMVGAGGGGNGGGGGAITNGPVAAPAPPPGIHNSPMQRQHQIQNNHHQQVLDQLEQNHISEG